MKKEKLSFYYQHPLSINISLIFKSIFAKKNTMIALTPPYVSFFVFVNFYFYLFTLFYHENTSNKKFSNCYNLDSLLTFINY